MVFGLSAQVLEDALFPEALHVVPILDQSMLDRLVNLVRLGIRICFITNKEVKILDATLGC